MYQEYQNDQFQEEEIEQKVNRLSTNKKQSYELEMNNYVSQESILPKILSRQKSVNQYPKIKQTKEKKKVFSSLQSQEYESIPKKSFSQYSVFKRKSRHNRYQSLDVNKIKTIEKQEKQFLQRKDKKKSSLVQSVKLKNLVSIKKNEINLRTSNQITKRLALNATNQTELQKIENYFSHSRADLYKMNQDQLNRINNRLYQWIEKFNRRLDQLLNKWIFQQGKKKIISQNNADKIVQLLQKHIQNNNDLLLRIDQENKKLQDKSGEMKEQQYQFLLYKQIDRIKSKIKEQAKNIIALKKKNQLSGTKIVHQQDSKAYQQKMDQIKLEVIKYRKQEDSNKVNIQQLERKYLKIKANLQKSEQSLKNLLKQAQEKQIVLNQTKLEAKWIQLKTKLQKMKASNNAGLLSIQKTSNKISQQNKLLKNQIKQYEEDIQEINRKISLIYENLQFFNQQKKETNKTKVNNSNSILFFYKSKKEPQTKITPTTHTSKIKQPENKSLYSLTKTKEKNPLNSGFKQAKQVVQQENQSQNKNQEAKQNSIKEKQKKFEQSDENEFMDLKLDYSNKQEIQQRQKVSISPKYNKKEPKVIQNEAELPIVQQQNRKKSTRKFFIKKRTNQEQR